MSAYSSPWRGRVGSNLADPIVRAGASEIVILDNFVRGRRENLAWAIENGDVELVEGDIRDRDQVAELTQGIDVSFHMAALRIRRCAEDPRAAIDVMVNGTYNVFEAAIDAGVRRVVGVRLRLATGFPTAEARRR